MSYRYLIYILLIFGMKLYASSLEMLIKAIDSRNENEVIFVFNTMKQINLKEARQFLHEFYAHYDQNYQDKNNQKCLVNSIYFQARRKFSLSGFNLLMSVNVFDYATRTMKVYLIRKSENEIFKIKSVFTLLMCNDFEEEEFPADLIIGGVEMLVGALICILPIPGAKWLGGTIIADGMHRTFNGIAEMDEQNKSYILGVENNSFNSD